MRAVTCDRCGTAMGNETADMATGSVRLLRRVVDLCGACVTEAHEWVDEWLAQTRPEQRWSPSDRNPPTWVREHHRVRWHLESGGCGIAVPGAPYVGDTAPPRGLVCNDCAQVYLAWLGGRVSWA